MFAAFGIPIVVSVLQWQYLRTYSDRRGAPLLKKRIPRWSCFVLATKKKHLSRTLLVEKCSCRLAFRVK
ncbi:hypothetical protein XENTR_v10008775 [Xenopus tropicalis]|nr:hypothetical protein XENTR_v10008775 [Xenopus tropicalis]